MICYLFEAPTYFFFSLDVPPLLYYSHIPAAVISLSVGLFVYINARHLLLNKLLFFISVLFTLWVIASLTAWTNLHGYLLAFIWPVFGILPSFIAIYSVYFIYVFLSKEDVSFRIKLIFLTLLAPVLLLGHTNLSISGFNITSCDAFDYEGIIYKIYYTLLGFISMIWIFVILFKKYKISTPDFKKQIILMGIGIEFFLFTFTFIIFIVTYLTSLGYFEDSRLELYGLFGMDVFMVLIGVLIVRFKAFNVGAMAAKTLVVTLLILIASQFTFITSITSVILNAVTWILTFIIGFVLIRSVKKEIVQREHIEHLAKKLEKANKRLKILDQMKSEFVSIASHQLRSPLTSIRGYASMLLEGSFGKISERGREAVERISESSRYMALSVEDYLNVSRIEAGRMKYEISDFNLKNMVEKIVDDVRPTAIKKGLVLTSKTSELTSRGVVKGDIGKTQQIIHNLIDNALKYTPKGTIMVRLRDDMKKKKIYVDVVDSGVGMDKDSMEDVFEKFVRAKNANKVNVTGTGLGLYVAKQMAEGMKGRITANSEGIGKGSVFTMELPLQS